MTDALRDELIGRLRGAIRDVPDFPRPGILFKDITPVLSDPALFPAVVDGLAGVCGGDRVDRVLAIESRGFIFGAPVAVRLGAGFVPARKPGKLPHRTVRVEYELEYGNGALEVHQDAIRPGERVLLVDDVLATGGTAAAAARLAERLGGEIVAAAFVLELAFLGGRARLDGVPVRSILRYDG